MWHATQSYFIGEWHMVRIIEDVADGVIGEVWGEARFEPKGAGLDCLETGVMRFNGADFLHKRDSLWQFGDEGRIEVRYGDGRPFHDFLTQEPIALLIDGDAEYRIEYDFGVDTWLSNWEMRGPSADYRMATRYRR